MSPLRLGARGSALALWQARHVAARLTGDGVAVELVEIVSTGDQVVDVPLADVEGTGFFTATLERALLDGRVDLAVHSCKDLPVGETPGLMVAAIPERGPVEDVLVAPAGVTLASLPAGAKVGTCSVRRTAQLVARRPDLTFVPLRGNVPTRVGRVTSGELDAIVLARAGLERLGLGAHIAEVFPLEHVLPAPAQGALAIQCRQSDDGLAVRLAALDDADARRAVEAERTVLHLLGGGCSVPVGAFARVEGSGLSLRAAVFDLAGGPALRASAEGNDAVAVGEQVADALLRQGAARLLAVADKAPRHWHVRSEEVS
ncbi:MAG: hydroxymethylbilane synthase [Vicinamibacterales bacterium]